MTKPFMQVSDLLEIKDDSLHCLEIKDNSLHCLVGAELEPIDEVKRVQIETEGGEVLVLPVQEVQFSHPLNGLRNIFLIMDKFAERDKLKSAMVFLAED